MMKQACIYQMSTIALFLLFSINTHSQNVGISDDGSLPDSSAMLDIKSDNKGLLPPRLSSTSRLAISNPATGLIAFDTDLNQIFLYNGSSWEYLVAGSIIDSIISRIEELQLTTGILAIDADGNIYKTVKIGNQRWMVENMRTTKTAQGTLLPLVTNNTTWSITTDKAYCWYNNDSLTYGITYGALYNYYAAMSICPEGWHLPSLTDWNILFTYLGADGGGKIKETGFLHWSSPNTGATNESGFTALPGGARYVDGTFSDVNNIAAWWTSSLDYWNGNLPNFYMVFHNSAATEYYYNDHQLGISVRCVQN